MGMMDKFLNIMRLNADEEEDFYDDDYYDDDDDDDSVVRKHSRKKILRSNSLLQKNRKHLQNLIPRLRRCVHQKRIREEILLWKYV